MTEIPISAPAVFCPECGHLIEEHDEGFCLVFGCDSGECLIEGPYSAGWS